MEKFLTAYGDRKKTSTPTGTMFEPKYEYKINRLGQKKLEVVGEINIYEEIQSYAEESKLENILARCIAGDTSVLRPDGIYADITNMPHNLLEARQSMQNLENTWNNLPVEIRAKYNHSVDEFIGKSHTTEWQRDMGLLETEIKETPITTVAETATIQAHGEVEHNES